MIVLVGLLTNKGKTMKRKIFDLLVILNSTIGTLGKYPLGNKGLTETTKIYESKGYIRYNEYTGMWESCK